MLTKFAFVDCETSGLDPRVHDVWECAVVLREPGMPDREHVWQFRPDLDSADPEALNVGRFHERFVVPDGWEAAQIFEYAGRWGGVWKLSRYEAAMEVQAVLCDARLVAANPAFDDGFLKKLLRAFDLRVGWHYRLMCVESLVAGAPSAISCAGSKHLSIHRR